MTQPPPGQTRRSLDSPGPSLLVALKMADKTSSDEGLGGHKHQVCGGGRVVRDKPGFVAQGQHAGLDVADGRGTRRIQRPMAVRTVFLSPWSKYQQSGGDSQRPWGGGNDRGTTHSSYFEDPPAALAGTSGTLKSFDLWWSVKTAAKSRGQVKLAEGASQHKPPIAAAVCDRGKASGDARRFASGPLSAACHGWAAA